MSKRSAPKPRSPRPGNALRSRWRAWVDGNTERQRCRQSKRALEQVDPRILADAGISEAQRFIAIHSPCGARA